MSERIEVGDLVMVVRACPYCGDTCAVGHTFIVRWVGRISGETECCNQGDGVEMDGADDCDDSDGAFAVCVLKKIPPLTEPESTETREGLTA